MTTGPSNERPDADEPVERLVEVMVQAVRGTLGEIENMADGYGRLGALQRLLVAVDRERQQVLAARVAAVAALRDAGESYDVIAARSGLSKARIAQLARQAKRQL